MIQEDLLYLLAHSIRLLPFESRKDCQSVFSYTFRFKPTHSLSPEPPALTHVVHRRPEVIVELCRGYGYQESAMPCGVVLRELLKQHEDVAAIILHDESREKERAISVDKIDPGQGPLQSGDGVFWKFFPWIDRGAFEVSTDAFTTFRASRPTLHAGAIAHDGLGTLDEAQSSGCHLLGEKLRSILQSVQLGFSSIEFLRHQKAIHQITGGNPTRSGKLLHHDSIC